MALKLNGVAFDPNAPSPAESKLINQLRNLPQDEVFDSKHLCERIGILYNAFHSTTRRKPELFSAYRLTDAKDHIWGHPKALQEYKKLVGGGK